MDVMGLPAKLLGTGETRGLALGLVFAGFLLLITAVIAFVSPPYRQLTAAYDAALARTENEAERTFLRDRREALSDR